MRRFLLGMGAAAALALGCGPSVVGPGQSSGTTSGTGGATTSTTTTTGFGGSFTSSSSSGGGEACDASTLFFEIAGDVPTESFDGSCLPMGAVTWLSGPTPPPPPKTPAGPPGQMTILACSTMADPVLTISAVSKVWPADVPAPSLTFSYAGGTYIGSADGDLDVVTFEPTGGVIEGTFSGTVTRQGPGMGPMTLKLEGKFRVCHGMDSYTV